MSDENRIDRISESNMLKLYIGQNLSNQILTKIWLHHSWFKTLLHVVIHKSIEMPSFKNDSCLQYKFCRSLYSSTGDTASPKNKLCENLHGLNLWTKSDLIKFCSKHYWTAFCSGHYSISVSFEHSSSIRCNYFYVSNFIVHKSCLRIMLPVKLNFKTYNFNLYHRLFFLLDSVRSFVTFFSSIFLFILVLNFFLLLWFLHFPHFWRYVLRAFFWKLSSQFYFTQRDVHGNIWLGAELWAVHRVFRKGGMRRHTFSACTCFI